MSLFNNNGNMGMNMMGATANNNSNMSYANQYQVPQMQRWNLPHYETPLLNGRMDANNFLIGPNSSIILPDAHEDIVWWIRTDNNGNKTIIPWDISLHQDPKPVDLNDIQARLANVEEWINAKQNKSNTRRNTATNVAAAADAVATSTESIR